MINIKNIHKSFSNKIIFKNASIKIEDNEMVGVVGINGIGKTTLMKMIIGIDVNYKGVIEDSNVSYSAVFANNVLPLYLSIYDICSVRKISIDKLDDLLKRLGAYEHKYDLIKDLSLGTQKKVNIIHSLLCDYDVLIMDEPTNSLDISIIMELKDIIKEIKNKTIIIISHDFYFLENLVNNVIFIESPKKLSKHSAEDENSIKDITEKIIQNGSRNG